MSTATAEALTVKEVDLRKKWYRKIESRLLMASVVAGVIAALIGAVVLEPSSTRVRTTYVVICLLSGVAACFLVHLLANGARYNLEGEWHQFNGIPDAVGTIDTAHTYNAIEAFRAKKSIVVTFTTSAHAHVFPYEQWLYDALRSAKMRGGPVLVERRRTSKAEYEARAQS